MNSNKLSSNVAIHVTLSIFSLATFLGVQGSGVAVHAVAPDCEQNAKYLNSRAAQLVAFQNSESKSYKKNREKWANKTIYASQWVQKEAKKTKKSIEKYDQALKELNDELNTQVKTYQVFTTDPASCANDVTKNKTQEKISASKKDYETLKKKDDALKKFYSKEFRKDTDNMMKKLTKAKNKNRKPLKQKIEIPAQTIVK